MDKKIRVFVIDDSAVVRKVISDSIDESPDMELVGTAQDPIFAMSKMEKDWPDVITLDVEMPRMDGLTFLKKLMSERPTPVVMCSTRPKKRLGIFCKSVALSTTTIASPVTGRGEPIRDTTNRR